MLPRSHIKAALILAVALGSGVSGPTANAQGVPSAKPVAPQAPAMKPAPQAQADDLVNKVQGFYDKTTSFKADFTQEFVVKAYNKTKTSRGAVTFSKPGKMDWIYHEPKDNRVVSDGSLLRVYEADNKQMFEQNVDKSQYPAALSFLTGQGKLGEHFTFELFTGEQMKFPGGNVLVGTPKSVNPAYSKVFLYVDGATFQVRRVLILDAQGNRNRFDFLNPRVNEPVTEAQFRFTPPPGTTVVKP